MIEVTDLFWCGVMPAFVAAAVLTLVWRTTGNAASAWRTTLVVGYIAGHWALDARAITLAATLTKSFRPTEARDWLPMLMLLAIVPDALSCVSKRGPALGGLLRVALCVVLPWRLLYGSAYLPLSMSDLGLDLGDFDMGGWSTAEASAWIGGIAGALLISWQWSRIVDQDSSPLVRSALALTVALGGAIVAVAARSIIYGQMFGVLSASLAGCSLTSALLSTRRGPEAAAGPLVIAFGSLLLLSHFYAELAITDAALLLVAMVLALGWLPLPEKLSSRWQAVIRGVVCLGILALPVIPAGLDLASSIAASESPSEAESNPYQNFVP